MSNPVERPGGWTRFALGDFVCTVVSDGVLEMGPARDNFPNADPAEVDRLLTDYHLDPDNVVLNQNLLLVDNGEQLILFDSGVGVDPELGRATFGSQTGLTVHNLALAGIKPADIDIVAITHAHPDHVWGLVDADGELVYPNAKVAVSPEDFEFWTDLDKVATAPSRHAADHFTGGAKNLLPYRDRLIDASDGVTIAPGVKVIATHGHSPGHVVYQIESGGETLICWGDLCHHQVLLLKRPEWSFQFDHDKPAATAQRVRIYDYVERNRHQVFAYHFPFPGRGHLRRVGDEYEWVPAELELALPEGVVRGIPEGSPLRAHAAKRGGEA
ncbi:MBL fold metallo-hydrolase [Amycolatopsis sp. NPDC004368]